MSLLYRYILFSFLYGLDLIQANYRLAGDILFSISDVDPRIEEFSIRPMSDWARLSLANLISMTPGTLTIDVDAERNTITVHLLYTNSAAELEEVFFPRFYRLFLGLKDVGGSDGN